MSEPFPDIPEVPQAIIDAAKDGRLVVFVGAGVSCLAGAPDWNGFADKLLNLAVKKGALDHSQLDQIKHLSTKVKLFIARNACDLTSEDYLKVLEPNGTKKGIGQRIYQDIQSLSKTIVTTNYDTWLDKPVVEPLSTNDEQDKAQETRLEKRIFYKKNDINVDKLMGNSVIHLHGSVNDPENMILTTKDYVDYYKHETNSEGKDTNSVILFLKKLFYERTVLFIGYGLGELEILDYILLKKEASDSPPKHYMLQPFYSHQESLYKNLKQYYEEECGVELVRYNMDKKGYDSLERVLNVWAGEITPKDLPPLDERREAEAWLDE